MCTFEENWSYEININLLEKKSFSKFESEVNNLCQTILKTIDSGFVVDYYSNNEGLGHNCDDDLKTLLENNKNLREEIDVKVKDLQQQQVRYKNFKHDQKLLSQEIKEKHESFLMAKKCYKKNLKIYYTIEHKLDHKQTIYVQFFTEAKRDTDNYSIHLLKNLETGKYELQSTRPKLKEIKEIQRKLQDSNDTPGTLCCIRDFFLAGRVTSKITKEKQKG